MSLLHGPMEEGCIDANRVKSPARNMHWVKCEFHVHASEDQYDVLNYSARQLIDRAAKLGFGFLALTLHRRVHRCDQLFAYAAERGILMVPSAELQIGRADVLVLNLSPDELAGVRSFEDLRRLRAKRGHSILVIAPHPYFVIGGSMGEILEQEIDCFDAVEICHLHTRYFDRNRKAVAVANQAGLPLLATSDAHELEHFGQHHSLLEIPSQQMSWEAVAVAIRAGRVRNVSPHLNTGRFLKELGFVGLRHPFRRWKKRWNSGRNPS